MHNLDAKHCKPCQGDEESLSAEMVEMYLPSVPEWQNVQVNDHPQLARELKRKDFISVLSLVRAIGEIAESEGHHPNLYIHGYNRLRIELFTHKTKGLHLNDFIMARKIDVLLSNLDKK